MQLPKNYPRLTPIWLPIQEPLLHQDQEESILEVVQLAELQKAAAVKE